ncbi:MAG: acyl-CoA dehydrogenase family protein [Caulobacter sp.]|nr:acyl-CoA dehydrogenase family protein [Caulobacter sp.]
MTLALAAVDVDAAMDTLRSEVRAFIAEAVSAGRFVPDCDSWLAGWAPAFSAELAARGWIGMAIPREYGGSGRGSLERYVVIEELLAAGAPVAAHWIADRQIAPALLRYGTEQQKQAYLPKIASARAFFALGMSEADAGSDLAAIRTKATKVEGGWRLNGAKLWTSGGHHAHAMVVLARTCPVDAQARHSGMSQFIVDLRASEVTINPILLMSGEHHFNEVVFEDALVSDDAVLGTIGDGWKQVTAELAYERSGPERLLSTFPLLTAMFRRLEAAADASEAELAALGALLSRARSLREISMSIASALQRGEAPDVAAAVAKDLGTRFEQDVVDTALRILDGVCADPSSSDELERLLSRAALHSPGFTLRGGTNEILRGVVARGLGLR